MNEYFMLFHHIVKKYSYKNQLGIGKHRNMVFKQKDFYFDLFSPINNSENIEESQISKWINGKEAVPDNIAKHIIDDSENSKKIFEQIFHTFYNDSLFILEKEYYLKQELEQLLDKLAPSLFIFSVEDDLETILATALISVLKYDYALKCTKLESSLESKLAASAEQCKTENTAFKTPYILNVLLENRKSLLWTALNIASPRKKWNQLQGGGNIFGALIHNYVRHPNHKHSYEEVNLDTHPLLNIARVLAFLDNAPSADEFYLCYALRFFSSSSINQMKPYAGKRWETEETWKAFLMECRKHLKDSSDLYNITQSNRPYRNK